MKKYVISLIVIVALCLCFAIVLKLNSHKQNYNNKNTSNIEYNIEGLTSVNLEQFLEKINDDEVLVYVSNSVSNYDSDFAQKIKKLKNEINKNIYVLDITTIDVTDSNYKKYIDILEEAKTLYNEKYNESYDTLVGTTPLFIKFDNSKVLDVLVGNQNYSKVKSFSKDTNV